MEVNRMKRRPFPIRYWRIYNSIGICLIASFFFSVIPVLFLWLNTILAVIILLVLLIGMQFYHLGSAAEVFSRLFCLFEDEIEFDWLRFILSTQKESILYYFSSSPYSIWIYLKYFSPRGEPPPEHYQVWKETSWPSRIRVSPYYFARCLAPDPIGRFLPPGLKVLKGPPDTISDELKPYFPRKETSIASLRHIGLARRSNRNILIALLTTEASLEDFQLVFSILDEIEDRIRKSNEPEVW